MSNATKEFFKQKKEWSIVKDDLLECYLVPYMQKIICTGKPVNYIDGFAGVGKFEDGNIGSPLIALRTIEKCKVNSNYKNISIKSYFIEEKYASELSENIKDFSNVAVINGAFINSVKQIIENKGGENLFIYIDPFGIKCLEDFDIFKHFLQINAHSVEVLLNFNSFGFIRDACRVLKASSDIIQSLDDIILEVDDGFFFFDFSKEMSKIELNQIAGGNYWQKIIYDFIGGKINGYEAEKLLAKEFCKKLNLHYKYVLNMPIKIKPCQRPKYRMIHLCNNEDGCMLMYKNMCKRFSDKLQYIQSEGEKSLFQFEENFENEIINKDEVKDKLLEFLKTKNDFEHFDVLLSEFITKYGVVCQFDILLEIFKNFEKTETLEIKRIPEFTKTRKKSIFWEEKRGKQSVKIRIAK